jgi:hypothetical protein
MLKIHESKMEHEKLIPLSTHTPRAEAFSLAYCGVTVSIGARVDGVFKEIMPKIE